MLTSFRKGSLALATAALCLATSAQAGNHVILIVDGAYFPEILQVETGDNVIFNNTSSTSHTVVSESGEWTTGELGTDQTFQIKMRDITELNFSGAGPDGEVMSGVLTLAAQPIIK